MNLNQKNRLPYPLTFAVIPDAPFAQKIANLITNSNHKRHELILHIPMEPLDYTHSKNGLLRSHSRPEFEQQLNYMLNNYPHIKGVNNHRGSLLTADTEKMTWLMNTLSTKKLYFLDSRTTAQSKAISAAKKANIPHISRDIFLDHQKDNAFIEHAFEQLRYTAKKYGHAVAIGHPYPLTLKKLEEELPKLIEEGFELTIGSQLAEVQKHGAML